jgi:PAS domain S-box-containing protein
MSTFNNHEPEATVLREQIRALRRQLEAAERRLREQGPTDGDGDALRAAPPPADTHANHTEARSAGQYLRVLSEVASGLLMTEEPVEVLDSILERLAAETGLELYFHFTVKPDESGLRLAAFGGIDPETIGQIEHLPFGEAICGTVAQQRCRIVVEDVQRNRDPKTRLIRSLGVTAYACHPLIAHGRLIGTLSFGTRRQTCFSTDTIELLRVVCDQVAVAIERKWADQARAEAMAGADAEHRRLQAVLDALPVAVFIADAGGRVVATNDAADAIWGHAPLSEGPNHYATDYAAWWPDGRRVQAHEWGMARAIGRGEVCLAEEMQIPGAEGGRRTILNYALPVRDSEGRILGGVAVNVDITERKEVEARLAEQARAMEEYARELARSNAELEQFASVLSHDLRSPMTAISGFAYLLSAEAGDSLNPEMRDALEGIRGGIDQMSRLIKSLLSYSRVGQGGLHMGPVNVQEVLEKLRQTLQPKLEEAGVALTSAGLPTVRADVGLLGQLLQNLIENAIKYRGDDPPEVHISARPDGDEWVFIVSDNGIGIAPEHHERVFAMFQRLHPDESRFPGTGIGLATCRKIVQQHGGRIWVESQAGEGSTFYFTLPR